MRLQTLEEFLEATGRSCWPTNAYVKVPGFKELYVRRTDRFLGDVLIKGVLDIARAEATRPGKGVFTALVTDLLERGIPLYIECVQNKRFVKKLESMGFTRAAHEGAPSFFKLPSSKMNLIGTTSGRFSVKGPNLSNPPRMEDE